MVTPPTESCAVAFKEWAGVCDALVQGGQTIVIRKGGISESAGPGSFAPEHPEFWLYPTWVHQLAQGLRSTLAPPVHVADEPGSVPIRALVRVDFVGYVDREETLASLRAFHVLSDDTMSKRFHYRRPGLWVLGARVWKSDPGFTLAITPEQAGCKTWVFLDQALPTTGVVPVIGTALWAEQTRRLRSVFDCRR